jgi:SAM-dependent methyltransferase
MMTSQGKPWIKNPNRAYHLGQFERPYRSTVSFCDWMDGLGVVRVGTCVLDLCCGMGANIAYMSQRWPALRFVGAELNEDLVSAGRAILRTRSITQRVDIDVADLYSLPRGYIGQFDGVVCLQTLSWLPGFEQALEAMSRLQPRWIALSSLFYDGLVSFDIRVREHTLAGADCESLFNIYALPRVRAFLGSLGYIRFRAIPFGIDVDLPVPEHGSMGTFTRKLDSGDRLQFSGPLLAPWYFVCAERAAG